MIEPLSLLAGLSLAAYPGIAVWLLATSKSNRTQKPRIIREIYTGTYSRYVMPYDNPVYVRNIDTHLIEKYDALYPCTDRDVKRISPGTRFATQ